MGGLLPVRPFTLKKAAKVWGTTEAKAEKLLDHLCEVQVGLSGQAAVYAEEKIEKESVYGSHTGTNTEICMETKNIFCGL